MSGYNWQLKNVFCHYGDTAALISLERLGHSEEIALEELGKGLGLALGMGKTKAFVPIELILHVCYQKVKNQWFIENLYGAEGVCVGGGDTVVLQ